MPIVLKSGRLKLLEISGPVQACNGIALHIINKLKKLPLYTAQAA
jgi:hypothetical protein